MSILRPSLLFLLLIPSLVALSVRKLTTRESNRREFLTKSAVQVSFVGAFSSLLAPGPASWAFEGGVGGLGKTKPETGVTLWEGSVPIQNKQGFVSGEIVGSRGEPILVQFQTPWPLLPTTSGLETRDLQNPDSAFVQVIPSLSSSTTGKKLTSAIAENVFGSQGKYGAYGTPADIKFKHVVPDDESLFAVTFTAYTPAMRESERKVLIKLQWVGNDTLVLLVTGTTILRFKSQEKVLGNVAESFTAVAAPKSGLR